jgi:hypothetical protein
LWWKLTVSHLLSHSCPTVPTCTPPPSYPSWNQMKKQSEGVSERERESERRRLYIV